MLLSYLINYDGVCRATPGLANKPGGVKWHWKKILILQPGSARGHTLDLRSIHVVMFNTLY